MQKCCRVRPHTFSLERADSFFYFKQIYASLEMFQQMASTKSRRSTLLITLLSLSNGRVWENTIELYEIKLPEV